MSTTLPLFWHLSSASTDERLDASAKLITSLEQFQVNKASAAVMEKDEGDESLEEDSEDEGASLKRVDDLNSEDVKYALRRLIRGLASPRESSRLGFSVALAELLSRLNTVDAAGVVSSILESSVTSGSMKGQEIRDALFARLFGLTTVIQSGLLFHESHLPASPSSPNDLGPPASSLTAYQTTISELLSLGDKKSWMRESAWWAIILAVKLINSASPPVKWRKEAMQWMLDTVYSGARTSEWTPDKLALTLCLQEFEPSQPWKNLLAPTFRNASLLSSPNLTAIARILKEVEDSEEPDTKNGQGGRFKVQVHSAWDAMLQALADEKSKTSFAEFYRICVDESLFAATSSPERKSWGFQVFERALALLPPTEFQYLFTPNFMRSWINHLASPDRHLHKAAKKAASEIVKAVERHPSVGFSFVTHLQGAHGNQQFDRITRTKTVETILASTDVEGVKKYTVSLVEQFRENGGADTDLNEQDTKRRYVIEQLSALMRNGSIPRDDEWVTSILELFILHGMFTVTKRNKNGSLSTLHYVTKPPLSDSLRSTCRAKLLTILGDLTSQTKVIKSESGQASRITASAADGELWVTKALRVIEALEQDTAHVALLDEPDEAVSALRARARKVLKMLQTKKNAIEDEAGRGAELLISALLLQTYNEEEGESGDVLESCLDATENLFSLSKKSKSSSSTDDDAHSPIDLLMDAIVGMLETSSGFGRVMATMAFGMLSGRAEGSTIDLILMQLEQRDVNAEESDQEEDNGEETAGRASVITNDSSDSSDSSEGDAEEDEEDDTEVDPEFRKQVAEALQVNGMVAADNDGGNSDSDSEGEVVLDDDQMMQLDEHLAKVFKSQAGVNTKEKKGAQREATHFKIRILDLLDVFLNKQPQSPFVPRVILPLVKIITSSSPDERQLSEKTAGILRSRIAKLKDIPTSGFDEAGVLEDLQSLHDIARKMVVPEVSACSIYLSRVLQGSKQVLNIYQASINDFVSRKNSKLAPAFLKDFVVRQIGYAWGLRVHIIEKCVPGAAVNVYRQMQVWGLVQSMLSQVASLAQQPSIVDELFTLIPHLRDALYSTLRSACQQTEHAPNAAQAKELLKIGLQAVRLTRKLARPTDMIESCWDIPQFEEVRQELANSERFKASPAVQTMAKQFASLLAPTAESQNSQGAKKRKELNGEATVINGTTETESRKKRKKVKKQRQD